MSDLVHPICIHPLAMSALLSKVDILSSLTLWQMPKLTSKKAAARFCVGLVSKGGLTFFRLHASMANVMPWQKPSHVMSARWKGSR